MQPNEVEHFIDLREPVGREKKKAATGLAATFGEGFLGRGGDRTFAKSAKHEAGTCTFFHAGRSSMRREMSSARRLAGWQFGATLGK